MSLILDALRKMEQERRARSGGTIDIRPDLLAHRPPAPRRKTAAPLLVMAGIAILAAGIGAGSLLHGRIPAATPDSPAPAPPAEAPVIVAPAPAAPAPLPLQPPAPLRAAAAPRLAPTAVAPPPASPAPARTVQPSASTEPAPAEPSGTPLTVSGIAWQEERGLRRAVVNGTLAGEGATVAGARIVEIAERRVRFSRGGETFDVPLSSAFPAR
ncbi:hypothetical protein [Geobacter sp.]|uniref:hypothetical protein n=1 Tax=Geobacter sp. TaxID=46610 RepID=UPI002628ABCD|nr:hypothetical protein [Geobacter sp.]